MFSFLLFPHRGCQNVCQRTCWKSQYCHLHADADLTTAFRKGKCVNMDCCCCFLVAQLCLTLLWPCGLQPTRLNHPWNFPGKNTGMGCHFLLQGIFPTQGLNPCLLCWQTDSLPLSYWEVFVNIKLLKSYYGNTIVFYSVYPTKAIVS